MRSSSFSTSLEGRSINNISFRGNEFDETGAVQLQIMSVPDYRRKLTQAALKNQYRTPPKDTPAWDAVFHSNLLPAGRLNRRIDPPKVHIRCHDEGQPLENGVWG